MSTTGGTKIIPLTQGQYAVVDAEDYDRLSQWRWRAQKATTASEPCFYAVRHEGGKTILMHREILQTPPDRMTDHHDGDTLNNRRNNLRPATNAQNQCNRGLSKKNTSGFKGIHFYPRWNKWHARIRANGKRFSLGYFSTKEAAAEAYNQAAIRLHRDFARINL